MSGLLGPGLAHCHSAQCVAPMRLTTLARQDSLYDAAATALIDGLLDAVGEHYKLDALEARRSPAPNTNDCNTRPSILWPKNHDASPQPQLQKSPQIGSLAHARLARPAGSLGQRVSKFTQPGKGLRTDFQSAAMAGIGTRQKCCAVQHVVRFL